MKYNCIENKNKQINKLFGFKKQMPLYLHVSALSKQERLISSSCLERTPSCRHICLGIHTEGKVLCKHCLSLKSKPFFLSYLSDDIYS